MNNQIGIIGGGNMGGAIFKSLINSSFQNQIYLADPDLNKLAMIGELINNSGEQRLFADANKVIQLSDIIILAIKPQMFDEFSQKHVKQLSQKLIVSIMAGVSIDKISANLNTDRIVRCMPNLPAQIGKGLTGYFCTEQISEKSEKFICKILKTFGQVVRVDQEDKINLITALSGSGPAYFFHLTKALEEKAKKLRFSLADARLIAQMTFVGAASTLENGQMSAQEWEKAVCSPGGTTEAALQYLHDHDFDQIFENAIEAAYKRANELSGK